MVCVASIRMRKHACVDEDSVFAMRSSDTSPLSALPAI